MQRHWEFSRARVILATPQTTSAETMTTPQRYSIGDAEVIRVAEKLADLPASRLFPDHQKEFPAAGLPEELPVSIHSWIVRMPNRLIVIDTGIGNDRDRGGNPLFDHLHTDFAERLAAAGVDRQQVDTVLMTHLHIDHVGWNTYHDGERWRPMFPNARYIFSALELEQWQREPKRRTIYDDSIKPLLDAGLAHAVGRSEPPALGDGLLYMPTPGHSPDHASIILASKGECALFGGDVMHHPIQVSFPHWNSTFCEDKQGAEASRRRILEWCAARKAFYFSSHFAGSSAGVIESSAADPGRYAWRFA